MRNGARGLGRALLRDGPRVQVKLDRELGEAAETRDHQGVLAWCEPYRYADGHELAAAERRASPASTRSPTRATWARQSGRAEGARARRAWSCRRTARHG